MRYETCLRCGRKLKSEESKIKGFGPTCERKYLAESARKKLFEVKTVAKDNG